MSCRYKCYTLQELVNIKYGKNQKKVQDNEKGKYPIYGTGGLMGYAKEFLYDKPSVLIGRKGSISKVKYVEHPFWTVDTLFYTEVNEKIVIPKYLYYRMSIIDLSNYNEGTTIPSLRTDTLNRIEFKIPSIEEQKIIVSMLDSLDKKIELNNEMNKTLEEMAQALFKRWFVDFEFPNEDGELYKFSGGEMVESEVGMIPKGWDVKPLYDIAEYINGTSFKAKDYCDKGLPIIKIAELKNGITNSTNFFQGEKDNKFYLKNRDILFSWSGNPDTSIDVFIWYKGEAILNQHIFKVVPNDEFGYCYTYILLKSLKSTFANIARNKQTTGLGHVTVKDLKELKIAVDSEKIKEFNLVLQPIINNIISNYSSLEILTELRDSLLPKLMSGEIRVEDIEANL